MAEQATFRPRENLAELLHQDPQAFIDTGELEMRTSLPKDMPIEWI